jgi:hypothetical protein
MAEYRAMFGLRGSDLAKRILDCPGGASSFTAEVVAAGGDVTAVDPIYDQPPTPLAMRAVADVERGARYVAQDPDGYEWSFFPDSASHRLWRTASAWRFAEDLKRNPEHYVTAALPILPFPDRYFDLVLSSHFLFSYGTQFDMDFHRLALRELTRVARHEVRIFPVVPVESDQPYTQLAELRAGLEQLGMTTELRPVDYRFQRGADQTLVITR